jgi:VanZ family protein
LRTRLFVFLAIALLIAYGSLYPFSFSDTDIESWRTSFATFKLFTSRGDVLGNCLLFVPFGAAGMFALVPRAGVKAGAFLVLSVGFVFALALQFAQLYLPSRDAVLSDVIWNGLGLAIGMVLAPILEHLRPFEGLPRGLPFYLLLLWFAQELSPFVPVLDWQKFKDALKPLFINLRLEPVSFIWHYAGALFAGRLLAELGTDGTRRLAVCAAIVIAGKVVVLSQVVTFALVSGLALACLTWPLVAASRQRDSFLVLLLLFALALTTLEPFVLRQAAADFNWLPFAGQLEGAMLANLGSLLAKVFLYAAILWLAVMRGASIARSATLLALLVLLLETAQMFIVGRTPDATEVLWVILTGAVLHKARTAR